MSAASCLLTEDQFLCSICLDVFTHPVTTPCGHNFCKTCITQYWGTNVRCQCPNCKEIFNARPELRVNIFISEMAAQFRQSAQQKASSRSSQKQVCKAGEVPCDVCTGTKLKALKSCLVCLASYCQTHLEPHLTMSGLKRHQLMEPVENLEGRMCMKHDKLLELFCQTDQMFVCMLCTVSNHKTHDVVPLKEEYEGKKAELVKTEAEIQQMIQKRQVKIEEMKRSVELSGEAADREIADGVQVFTALKESVERSQTEFINTIKEKQRETEKQAEGFIKELEQEICELKKRGTEVEQLSQSQDHLHLLQSFLSLKEAPPTKDWTQVSIHPPSYEGTVVRSVNLLQEKLSKQIKKLFDDELKKRGTEVEQLSRSEDHLHLLQSVLSLKEAPSTKDWQPFHLDPSYNSGPGMGFSQPWRHKLMQESNKLFEAKLKEPFHLDPRYNSGRGMEFSQPWRHKLMLESNKLFETKLKKVQQYEVDVTLDPDTAHYRLILSDDGKQVKHGDVKKNVPDNPKRFDDCVIVLAKQSFSSGRFYFEVQVKWKTEWDLGVVRESINRKGQITLSPQNGFWTICLRKENEYLACADPSVRLSLQSQPEKVGVFVDYKEGLVSFYDVDAAALIYSFTGCSFTHKLHPYFCPCKNDGGKNSAPLIISAVNHTE